METRSQWENGRKAFLRCTYLVLSFTISVTAFAQRPGPFDAADRAQIRERMERMFVAYLTEELDLSTEMGQRFWPIYNGFEGSMQAADSAVYVSRRELSMASDEPLEVFEQKLERLVDAENALTALRAEYVKAVAAALGPELAVKMLGAKKRFERDMRRRLGDRMFGSDERPLGGRDRKTRRERR